MNSGWQLFEQAEQVIPGGNGLLSKSPYQFLPQEWPCYFQSAKGVTVTDLSGRKYLDFTHCGVGASVLGYADEEIDEQVKAVIGQGLVSTLLPYEEVMLAERLVGLHPWSDMARFALTGGEAMSMAFRIARAAKGRTYLIFCSYSGWTDNYLAVNLSDQHGLDELLLPGLPVAGVPRQLKDTAFAFRYNQLDELEWLVKRKVGRPAAIVVEPVRSQLPAPGFLEGVRAIANRTGAVLIFDEISSGFRLNMGGAHLCYGVEPDMAVFGKAIANGYPLTAIIGRREIMEAATKAFISSTHHGHRLSMVAGLATLEKFEREQVADHLNRVGTKVQRLWLGLAQKHELKLTVSGIPPLAHFEFDYPNRRSLRTLFTQEMLERGFLASNSFYPMFAHQPAQVGLYGAACCEVFGILREAIEEGTVAERLKGEVVKVGFKRLT